MITLADLTPTSVETITAFDMNGDFLFTLDELQSVTIGHSEDTVEITGRQGRLLNTLKRNKAVTLSGNNGMVSMGMLGAQIGADVTSGTTTYLHNERLTVNSNKATTTYKAVGTAGKEIVAVRLMNGDALGTVMEQASTAAAGKFAYNPTSKQLTFNDGELPDGTEIAVFYNRKINANTLTNPSDKYGYKAEIFLDVIMEDMCSKVYRVQFHFFRMDFNGTFDLEFGENQAVHAFEANSLSTGCNSRGELWEATIFESDTADAA